MDPQLILINWHNQAVKLAEIFSSKHFRVHFANTSHEAAKAVSPTTFLAVWDARGCITEMLGSLSKWEADPDLARPPLLIVVRADEIPEILSERPDLDLVFMHPAQLSGRVSQYLALFEQRIELRTRQKSEARLRQDLEMERQNRETASRLMNENERTLSRIFEPMESRGEAIILANINAVTYYTNPAFQRLTGLDSKSAFGTPAMEVLDLNNPPIGFEDILEAARQAGPWRGEVQLGTFSQPPRSVHLEVDAIRGSNQEFEGYFFIIRDVNLLRNLMDNLQALAQLDLVTQLYNRVHFMEQLESECARARRYGHPIALLLIDLDHFRDINQQHGHIAGDAVLSQVGTYIRDLIRNTDFAARHDGDAFAIALPDTDVKGGNAFAERLLKGIGEREFTIHLEESLSLKASIGLAVFDKSMDSPEAFMAKAYQALLLAKEKGGDTFETADHL